MNHGCINVSLNPSKAIVASQLSHRIFNEVFFFFPFVFFLCLGPPSHSILPGIFRLLFSASFL